MEGLTHVLKSRPYIALVHEATSFKKALKVVARYQPSLILMDCNLKKECCHENVLFLKAMSYPMEIVMMSKDSEETKSKDLFRSGAMGLIRKDMCIPEITKEIERVLNLKCRNAIEISKPTAQFDFKDRELEVITLLCKSLSSKEIGDILCISKNTVDGYRKRILKKMKLPNTAGVVRWAVKNGISEIN
jgi:DNA-binding NarL/FixJ family response regulator